ncbi:MAG: hypothetical protein MJZ16_04335 [Bacteroidales bacterium]|nr:hypothetical protein [Bacteroidales bacterium]
MKYTNNQTKQTLEGNGYVAPLCTDLNVDLASIICQSGPGRTEDVTDIDSEW